MKKALFLIAIFLGSFGLIQAQELKKKWGEDSVKCTENLYIYYELAKAKNYAEAYNAWLYVFNHCPGCSKNNFIFGPSIVETQIKIAESQEKKDELVKLLMDVYDTRLLYFPEKYAYVYERKALDMQQHWPDSIQQYYDIFEKALELDKVHSAAFYNGYFIAVAKLFNKDVFEIGQVFGAYNVVIEGIEYNTDELNRQLREYQLKDSTGTLDDKGRSKMAQAERELGRYDDVSSNINKILGPIATCDKLELIYNEASFEANKTDATWLRRAAKMLEKERMGDDGEETDCTDNPIFAKVAEALYEIEQLRNSLPSHMKEIEHNGHIFYLKFETKENRDHIMKELLLEEISCSIHYTPLHSSIKGRKEKYKMLVDRYTTSESDKLLRLPMFNALNQAHIDKIAQTLKNVLTNVDLN